MFRAIYPFSSTERGTLNANPDDLFCGMTVDRTGQWMQVTDGGGAIGFLPKNYLEHCKWAEKKFVVQFIDDGLNRIHQLASVSGKYTTTQHERLRLLTAQRAYVTSHYEQYITQITGKASAGDSALWSSPHQLPSAAKGHGLPPAVPARTSSIASPENVQFISETAQPGKEEQFEDENKLEAGREGLEAEVVKLEAEHEGLEAEHEGLEAEHEGLEAEHEGLEAEKVGSEAGQGESEAGQGESNDVTSSQDWSPVKCNCSKCGCSEMTASPSPASTTLSVEIVASQLVDVLRDSSGLSYEKCKTGVAAVLECLIDRNVSSGHLPFIYQSLQEGGLASASAELSHDVVEMQAIFETIGECKDDSQQRSWHLHEDEEFISDKLSRLLDILTAGNRDVLVESITDNLDCVLDLVLYYQMEARSSLRAIMLQIFAALCTMSVQFISTLLCSVLTPELVRDLMSTEDEQRMMYSAIVLSMMFSTGETIPVHHNDILSGSFVRFLLDKIEASGNSKEADVCLELLLSFNQHFTDVNANTVMQELGNRQEATILTQNFLKLFNEGNDPVKVIPNDDQMSSVLMFAIDLYSLESTSQLIYTNDVKVLIDIIIRQLTDLSAEDKERMQYLSLMQLIVTNSDYNDHCHRKEDLVSVLNQIEFNEETTSSQAEYDVEIIQKIRKHL